MICSSPADAIPQNITNDLEIYIQRVQNVAWLECNNITYAIGHSITKSSGRLNFSKVDAILGSCSIVYPENIQKYKENTKSRMEVAFVLRP